MGQGRGEKDAGTCVWDVRLGDMRPGMWGQVYGGTWGTGMWGGGEARSGTQGHQDWRHEIGDAGR